MDIEERIKRRTQNETQPRFITDYQLISPVAHANEPVARGPLLEQLLDFLEPAFNGSIPRMDTYMVQLGQEKRQS